MRKLTRRSLAMAAVAIPALAQQPSSPAASGPQQPQQPAGGDLDAARALVRQRIDQLRKVKVPQLLEPATTFRA